MFQFFIRELSTITNNGWLSNVFEKRNNLLINEIKWVERSQSPKVYYMKELQLAIKDKKNYNQKKGIYICTNTNN